MKNNLIPTLRNGISVAFVDVLFSRAAFGAVTVHGFDVILGNALRLGAAEVHEISASIYAEIFALAVDAAEEINAEELIDARAEREWAMARR